MKGSRQELKVDGAVELPHVIAYLEQLVQSLKSGAVEVRQGDESLVLGPRGVVGFSLAAVDKGKRQRLALELTWRKFKAPDPALDLTLGPAPAAEAAAAAEAVEDVAAAYTAGGANPYAEKAAERPAEEAAELGEGD